MLRQFARSFGSNAQAGFTKYSILPNGVKVFTATTQGKAGTVGVYVDAGSSAETEASSGASHLISSLIAKNVSGPGAKVEVGSSRDQTSVRVTTAEGDAVSSVNSLAKSFSQTISDSELDSVRGQAFADAHAYQKEVKSSIFEHAHSGAFGGSGHALPLKGRPANIKNIKAQDLESFKGSFYTADKTIVVATGSNVDHDAVVNATQASLSIAPGSGTFESITDYTGMWVRIYDEDLPLVNSLFAFQGPPRQHEDFPALLILKGIYGEWSKFGLSSDTHQSRVNETLFSEHLAESLSPFLLSYRNLSFFGSHMVSTAETLEDATFEAVSEWPRLAQCLSERELEIGKAAAKLSILKSYEGSLGLADSIAADAFTFGTPKSVEDHLAAIDAVSLSSVQRVASEYLTDTDLTIVGHGPVSNAPDYSQVRGWTYMNRL